MLQKHRKMIFIITNNDRMGKEIGLLYYFLFDFCFCCVSRGIGYCNHKNKHKFHNFLKYITHMITNVHMTKFIWIICIHIVIMKVGIVIFYERIRKKKWNSIGLNFFIYTSMAYTLRFDVVWIKWKLILADQCSF